MENLTFWNKRAWFWIVALWVGFSGLSASASPSNIEIDFSNASLSGADPLIFTFGCTDGRPGDTICVPVSVQNFNDILIFQFEITWNSDVLDFIEVQNPGSPSINISSDFNLSGPNSLKVIPLGFPPIDGESQPDGTVMFELCFRIIGIPGSTSSVGVSPYFDFEAVDTMGLVQVDSVDCILTVQNAVELVGFISSCGPAVLGGDGVIDVTVYGGSAPYNITWIESMGATGGPIPISVEGGSMVLNVPQGNYDVIITDAGGNSVTYNIDVNPLALGIVTHLKHPTCYKFKNGTMYIKPTGGSEPYSFIWKNLTNPLAGSGFIRNSGDSSLVTSLPDGVYTILVKDNNGCEEEVTVVLNDNPFVFSVDDIQDASCKGAEDGFIMLTVTGATPDASGDYLIRIKQNPVFEVTTNNISIGLLDPGNYCITVSDEVSQCDTVYCFTIGSLSTITANVTAADPSCFNGTNGSVTIQGMTDGVAGPAYTYTIYNSMDMIETSGTVNGAFNYSALMPGDYAIVVAEGSCNSDSIYFTLANPPPMSVTVGGTTIDDCLDFPMFATGTAWFQMTNGTAPYILDAGFGNQDADTITNLQDGNYVVTVTDDNGCTATSSFTIFRGDDNEEADITFQIDGTPCDGGTITLLYQGMAGLPPGASVSWNSNTFLGQTIPITGTATLFADLFLPGIHCILNDTVHVTCAEILKLDITVINPICPDEALGGPYTGTVIVDTMNAVPPVTWIWSFSDTTQTNTYSGLSPGIYYVTVSDANDSIAIDTFEIIAPDAIHLSFGVADSTSCDGICDGAVRVTPADGDPMADYFLYWDSNVPFADTGIIFQVSNLCEGLNSFQVSQDGICFYTDTIQILSPDPVEIDLVSAIDASCHGFTDASIEVVASGGTPGYMYDWPGGSSSAVNNGIPAGQYFVNVTDSHNCSATDSFIVNEPDTLIAQIDTSATFNLSCGSGSDGVITVEVSGGNPGGYTFLWNPDVSSIPQAVNLAAGNYIITVADAKGCTDTTSYTLTSPIPIVVNWPDIVPPACFGDETILQITDVSGGSGNYTYTINGGEFFDIDEPVLIPSGIYLVSVFDDRGCSSDTAFTVMEPNPILVSIGPDSPIIDLGDSLFIIGNVDQSDNPIAMMNWFTAGPPVSCDTCAGTWVFNFLPTLYTWMVTDVNGCQGSSSIMVGVDFDRDVFIPNVFSPNFDGRNDDFHIYVGHGVISVNFFHIYDRWGNLVHSETNPPLSLSGHAGHWDGTRDGEPLSPGVYVYVAEVQFIDNDTKLVFRGDVTLIK